MDYNKPKVVIDLEEYQVLLLEKNKDSKVELTLKKLLGHLVNLMATSIPTTYDYKTPIKRAIELAGIECEVVYRGEYKGELITHENITINYK